MYLPGILAATASLILCTVLPFLPGGYDRLAVPLSAMAQMVGAAGLVIVPFGALWLAAERLPRLASWRFAFGRAHSDHHRSGVGPHFDRRGNPERCRAGIRRACVGRVGGSEDLARPHWAERRLGRKDARAPDLPGLRAHCGGSAATGPRLFSYSRLLASLHVVDGSTD